MLISAAIGQLEAARGEGACTFEAASEAEVQIVTFVVAVQESVGCGSGVLCSMFARMVTENGADGKVVGIDYIKALVDMSDTNIKKGAEKAFLDSGVITLHQGDGWKGVPESAPYDAIHVGAAAATMPQDLVDQLAPGGRMVIPVGTHDQVFKRVDKDATGKVTVTDMMGVRYVPLVKDPEQY